VGGDVALSLQSLASACHPFEAMNPTGSHALVVALKGFPETVGKHSWPANSGRPSIELQHTLGSVMVKQPVPGSTARGGGGGDAGGGDAGVGAGWGSGAAPGGKGGGCGGCGGDVSHETSLPSTVT
jgi:hypothetical protein